MDNPLQMMQMAEKGVQFGAGAAAIGRLLEDLDVKLESERLRAKLSSIEKVLDLEAAIKRLRLMEQFVSSGASPSSMVLEIVPILPPDLRPMVRMKKGGFITTEINESYRRLVFRNIRLTDFLEQVAPELVLQAERIILQDTVDTLMDNGRRDHPELASESSVGPKRAVKSLSDIIKGKEGRFRQNLLGKRVDYSGRSVVVSGPDLNLGQCGLPYDMAVELFKPFLGHRLIHELEIDFFKEVTSYIREEKTYTANILVQIMLSHPVLLNRAPTLHRYGIQAFYPIVVYGQAIRLHPSVCVGFNADFDGDQMAVHVPLSLEAQAEAGLILVPAANLFSPAKDQDVVVAPTQDMVMGVDYLTAHNPVSQLLNEHYFSSFNDAITAYRQFVIHVQSFIWVRINENEQKYFNFGKGLKFTEKKVGNRILYLNQEMQINKTLDGETVSIYIKTTPGRILFNQALVNFNNEFV
jgi:DNA-directed RNA polymerase subunit beta'